MMSDAILVKIDGEQGNYSVHFSDGEIAKADNPDLLVYRRSERYKLAWVRREPDGYPQSTGAFVIPGTPKQEVLEILARLKKDTHAS